MVVGQAPGDVHREGAARKAQALAEEQETVGVPVAVVSGVVGEAVVGVALGAVGLPGVRVEDALLAVAAPAEVELRLEEDGGVLGELVLQAHTEAVTVREAVAGTVRIGDEGGAVRAVGLLVGVLQDIPDGTIIEVVASQLHLVVEEVEVGVHTAHPGGVDAVAAPAAAHHAAAAHHSSHHIAGEVVETAVVGIVGIGDDADLALFREAAAHEGTLPAPVVQALLAGGDVVTAAAHQVAEHAVHHPLLHAQVNHRFVFSVIDAGEFGLLALLLHHLHLLDELGGNVLGGQLRVVQEEGFAVYGYLGDGFSVGGDGAVLVHLHAGKLLQEVFQHIVIGDFERRGVVLHRIFLDDDGIAHGADGSGIQHLLVQFHLHDAQVGIGP